ncbi:hypothetical protein [Dictyobacter arantiisoli]|nr:hypothetical protein [Dictyobacter arantiisoli]
METNDKSKVALQHFYTMETCPTCSKQYSIYKVDKSPVPWRQETGKLILPCGHNTTAKYSDDEATWYALSELTVNVIFR